MAWVLEKKEGWKHDIIGKHQLGILWSRDSHGSPKREKYENAQAKHDDGWNVPKITQSYTKLILVRIRDAFFTSLAFWWLVLNALSGNDN